MDSSKVRSPRKVVYRSTLQSSIVVRQLPGVKTRRAKRTRIMRVRESLIPGCVFIIKS
jgi:hypothetical protein